RRGGSMPDTPVGIQCGFSHIADEMAIPSLTKSPLRTEINVWKSVGTLGTEPLLQPGFLRNSGNVHISQKRLTLPPKAEVVSSNLAGCANFLHRFQIQAAMKLKLALERAPFRKPSGSPRNDLAAVRSR